MSAGGRKPPRRRGAQRPRAVELWRPVPALEEPAPIVPVADRTALLRSLGDPPLQGQSSVAQRHLALVVERAAAIATALAYAADLLAEPDEA